MSLYTQFRQETSPYDGYLMRPYLRLPYLTDRILAELGMQVFTITASAVGMQVNRVLYNTKNLRILMNFPSRGSGEAFSPISTIERVGNVVTITSATPHNFLPGMGVRLTSSTHAELDGIYAVNSVLSSTSLTVIAQTGSAFGAIADGGTIFTVPGYNWVVTAGAQSTGDFSPINVNTDIVEQVFRSPSVTSCSIVCDTQVPNGVFIDTLAILNHNFTNSATITVDFSMNNTFTGGETLTLFPDATNEIIWVAPLIPTTPWRYVRFTIADGLNPFGYLQCGAIVFGSALIFNGENIVDQVTRTSKHYADKIQTEGFTSVASDRALRGNLQLEFKSLDFMRENYYLLQLVFNYARTNLKCLWIPTPEVPTRFALFGKLVTLPVEYHNSKGPDKDYVSMMVEVDDSI